MLPYESPLIVLAQNRSKNNPTSKLIHGPVPCAIRSVTAVRVWMTLSRGGAGTRAVARPARCSGEALVVEAPGGRRATAAPGYRTRARPSCRDQLIGESVTMLLPSTR